jgi:hypothetical protein
VQASAAASTVTRRAKEANGKLLSVRGKLEDTSDRFIVLNRGEPASDVDVLIRVIGGNRITRVHCANYLTRAACPFTASRAHPRDCHPLGWPVFPTDRP